MNEPGKVFLLEVLGLLCIFPGAEQDCHPQLCESGAWPAEGNSLGAWLSAGRSSCSGGLGNSSTVSLRFVPGVRGKQHMLKLSSHLCY